jgi:hypothetical protein
MKMTLPPTAIGAVDPGLVGQRHTVGARHARRALRDAELDLETHHA